MVFASSVRYRQQESVPPPPGSGVDSFYGVRSLNGSMCTSWSGDEGESSSGTGETLIGTAADGQPLGVTYQQQIVIAPSPEEADQESTDETSPVSTIRRPLTPPPPDNIEWRVPDLPQADDHYLSSLRHVDDLPRDHSEPSSPASFTSLPSYVASLSSLSRTSSPSRSAFDLNIPGRQLPSRTGHSPLSDDDLVLPTINLPSSSLHDSSSLRRWELRANEQPLSGSKKGLKIAVIADEGRIDRLVALLKGRYQIEEGGSSDGLGYWRRDFSVVQDGRLLAQLVTGLGSVTIMSQISSAYTSLHDLLNPVSPPEANHQLVHLIDSYTSAQDWVHLVVSLENESDNFSLHSISLHLPLDGLPMLEDSNLAEPSLIEETPRCEPNAPSGSYFTVRQLPSSPVSDNISPTEPPIQSPLDSLGPLIAILESPSTARQASIEHFLTWRSTHLTQLPVSDGVTPIPGSLESSMTSTSAGASLESDTGPIMPTVARAQGGGEWEAGLSRRVAKRRESEEAPRGVRDVQSRGKAYRGRYRGKNRSPSTGRGDCEGSHLFPRSRHGDHLLAGGVSLGLGNMVGRVFGPFRRVLGTGIGIGMAGVAGLVVMVAGADVGAGKHHMGVWRKVAVACAVAVAVGWGCLTV